MKTMRKYALLGFLIVVLILPFLAHSQTVIRVQRITASGTASPTPTPTPWPCSDFSDAFTAGTLNGAIWVEDSLVGGQNPLVTVATGGQLTVTIPLNPGGSMFNGAYTAASHNLTGGYFSWEVVQVPDNASAALEVYGGAAIDDNNWVVIAHVQGNIYMMKRVGGGSATVVAGPVAYNSSTQRYWRIRESGGSTFWETSADRLTWNHRWDETNPFAMTAVFYGLATGANSAVTHAAASAIFDNACAE